MFRPAVVSNKNKKRTNQILTVSLSGYTQVRHSIQESCPSLLRLKGQEVSRLKEALYRIWCGVNRLGDSCVNRLDDTSAFIYTAGLSGVSRGGFWLPGNPPDRDFCLNQGLHALLAPSFTSHLNCRLLETPLRPTLDTPLRSSIVNPAG